MKKNFKYYALIWLVFLVAFNAVVFIVKTNLGDGSLDTRFWIAWAFVMAAFFGNLCCAGVAFKAENLKKMFLGLPLITVSRTALITMAVIGTALMSVPFIPAWIAAVVCVIIFALSAIAVIKAAWAAETASKVEDKVKSQTSFIKMLTVDADGILARAKSEPVKAECKKVYEAVRYSDPMSNEGLSLIEAQITVKMSELALAVGADDAEKAKVVADEIVVLIGDRNRKCKGLKQ